MACEQHERAIHTGDDTSVPEYQENDLSEVGHVIGVVSGKGGVGKSLVCGILAVELARRGLRVGILDADIPGPSVPRMFGMAGQHATALGKLLLPNVSKRGVKVMSANLVLPNETDPVLWRGPVLAGAIRQFWSETSWGPVDYLLVDMPPGTGDVPLTVFQSLPVDGIVIVSSPQDLVGMVVGKAVRMAELMKVPVLGLVENMSYATCPHCGERIEVFGPSHVDEVAERWGLEVLGRLPFDPAIAAACDAGTFEDELPSGLMDEAVARVEALPARDAGEAGDAED